MAGQTINDRFLAARHSIAGQGLAKAVCKATTEELIAPKKKHLDYLIHCTNEPNVSIPQMATLLIERSQNTNWVVVYKSLITTHHLMCYGNERFTQYMASSNSTFQLSSFLDKSSIQGVLSAKAISRVDSILKSREGMASLLKVMVSEHNSWAGHDMSPFIRRYARYLNEKALSYRTVAFDFCKVKRGKDDGMLRTMNSDKLLKTLPALQGQIDALLEFNCNSNDLTNSVINICFMLLFRDLIRLFACYNDAIINLLEKFFDMNKKQAREALELYKKFLVRMDLVGDFLKVAEYIGIDKGDIPDLTKAPSSLLDALEQHLASIEGKKSTMSQSANNARNFKSGVTALSSTSNAFGTAATNSHTDSVNGFAPAFEADEAMLRHVIVEEEEVLNKYKSKIKSPSNGSMASMQNNPFMSPTGSTERVISPPRPVADLFAPVPAKPFSPNPSDDLLQLGNPFVDAFDAAPVKPQLSVQMTQQVAPQQNNIWMNNGFMSQQQQQTPTNNGNSFVSESSFQTIFGNSEQAAAIPLTENITPSVCFPGANNPFMYDEEDYPVTATVPPDPIYPLYPEALCVDIPDDFIQDNNKNADPGNVVNCCTVEVASVVNTPDLELNGVTIPPENFEYVDNNEKESVDSEIDQGKSALSDKENLPTLVEDVLPIVCKPKVPRKVSKPPRPPPPVVKTTASPIKNIIESPAKITAEVNLIDSCLINPEGSVPTVPYQQPVLVVAQPILAQSGVVGQLTPTKVVSGSIPSIDEGFDALGNVMQPASSASNSQNSKNQQNTGNGVLTGDLESSLASLAENLTINRTVPKSVVWNSPKNGSNWTPQPMASTTGIGYRPMGQGINSSTSPPILPPSPYQPHIAVQGVRPGMLPTMIPGTMPGMAGYPASAGIVPQPMMSPTNPVMPQQPHQQSLLFH